VALGKVRSLYLAAMAVILVLAVRALRPLVTVRLGVLAINSIGVVPSQTEVYLCERDAGLQGRGAIDIFFFDSRGICNLQLKKMLERTLRVSSFTALLERVHGWLPRQHRILWPQDVVDTHGLLPHTEPHLSFTDEEEEEGRKALLELGVPEGTSFVCFHARDPAYTAVTQPEWNRSESTFRNCNVETFLPAAEALAGRGYFALRMGHTVQGPLPATGPRVIDYATNGRTDFLDIYLNATCRFFIGSASGLFAVPMSFRRPLVLTNWSVLEAGPPYWGPDILFIPKKSWSHKDGRLLSIREILDSGVGLFYHAQDYDQAGIELVDNTPEEITAVVMEMEERLKGTWQSTEEDEELQQRFWSPFIQRLYSGSQIKCLEHGSARSSCGKTGSC